MSSQATLSVGGMTCTNCSSAIEKLLTSLKGIDKVSVSLVLNSCTIKFDEPIISIDIIIEEIEDIGFEVSLVSLRKSSLLQSSSDSIAQNINIKSKYYVTSNQINKHDIIIWSSQINSNDDDIKMDEAYFYQIMNDIEGIIEILYHHNTSNLSITFNKSNILPMTITHLIQSYSNNQLIISHTKLEKKYIQHDLPADNLQSEIKNIVFSTTSFHKSFTTMRKKQLQQAFNKNITCIELDMYNNTLLIQYYNSTDAPHTARDIYKYLKHEMNFHDILCVDTLKNEGDIYYIQQQKEMNRVRNSFYISCLFGIPAFIIALILPHFQRVHENILMYPIIPGNNSVTLMGVMLFLLATPVQFWIGKRFYISAWNAAKRKTSNMSTLIALGTTMAWIYSFCALLAAFATTPDASKPLHEGAQFFETSTTVIMVILLGQWLQAKAKYKTCDAIGMLMELQTPFANLIEVNEFGEIVENEIQNNDNEEISTELIVVGDIIKVFSGGRIPLDGRVIYGTTSIDESMITGESIARNVSIGDTVISSSINCGNYMLLIRVDKNKSNCVISKVIELMKSSQMNKPKQEKFADTVSSYFVPVVIFLSLVTFLLWYGLCLMDFIPHEWIKGQNCIFFALLFAMAVMVIACPCALGLATPTAVMVGMGVATKYGCLIKGGNVLELAYNIDVLVFDKTGTLTSGKPQVINIKNLSDKCSISRKKLLFYLGSAELNSQHPLAKAIVSFTQKELRNRSEQLHLLTPTLCEPIPGRGIKAIVDGHNVNIGNYEWFFNSTISNTLSLPANITRDDIENILFKQNNNGYITLLISIDNELIAYLTLFDSPRPESKKLIAELQNKYKIKCVMLTGDNHNTALAIAKQLGINETNVLSQVLPQDKHQIIKELQCGKLSAITNDLRRRKDSKYVALCTEDQDTGTDECMETEAMIDEREYIYRVGMVGDGINDAVALSQADFGIAIGNGTDIAIEAADMILMNDNLWNIATLLDLSKTIIHRIYINFVFSFGFNILGIPIAAGILYPSLKLRLPPEIASICMAASSLCVLTSSILLKWYKSPY